MPIQGGNLHRLFREAKQLSLASAFLLAVFLLAIGVGLMSCGFGTQPRNSGKPEVPREYSKPPEYLETRDCGRCHIRIFNLIKNKGGRHKIRCTRCHEEFHTVAPGKRTREEVLPKCAKCHDKPHGEILIQCLQCHQEVHAPLDIPVSNTLALGCDKCHQQLDKDIKMFVTQHSNYYCTICHHTRHRYIPECMECHMPHTEAMFQPDCLVCHDPHKALQVTYPDDMQNRFCAICHRIAFDALNKSTTKHTALQCTKCHPEKHRTIKECKDCHQPHDESILKNRVCGDCHGIAHHLVIK